MKSEALSQLALVMRKSDLKKRYLKPVQLITPLQSAWVRCLLDVWGGKYGGSVGPDTAKSSVIGHLMIRQNWSDKDSERIFKVVMDLHKQGYSGNELFTKAQQIILLNDKVGSLLERANEQEDADLVEQVMCKLFTADNPIRAVAIKHYCERKCAQHIAAELSKMTGMDIENAKTRIRWCRQLLEASVFHAIRQEIDAIRHDIAA
ncbi:hypothetical protein MT962_000637 [Franconibacter sp. IITDAS19]|uniref:hypothetical protein n=1 Tax=Franconibacter sp. IITDAS19 TaxID=2930569 RepID=UPI001FFB0D13|nr:hypothetical protein [Franconibacter sp. IITDAS19]MCK1966851.1 hypothetical protein [Franconibacter sp. IITDAS19]